MSATEQLQTILTSLEELSENDKSETGIKARGLIDKFAAGVTLLGLYMTIEVTGPLHELSKLLQSRTGTISNMATCIDTVRDTFNSKRNEEYFATLLQKVQRIIADMSLNEIELLRVRKPPKRFTGPSASYQPPTVEEHYRKIYYAMLDTAIMQLDERWKLSPASGITVYSQLENTLMNAEISDCISTYPELDSKSLLLQLQMFHQHRQIKTLSEAQNALTSMSSDMRRLFAQVEQLVRLLLVCPVSSCEAERSFSALRRLKTWLRNSMGQVRLNSAAVCHTHKDRLDELLVIEVAKEFASKSAIRITAFGNFGS